MKVVVFDLGGTLMQYKGMPDSWVDFYKTGFEAIHQKYDDNVAEEAIEKSVQMLAEFNPRLSGREIEYSTEFIFTKVLEHWCVRTTIQNCIETFWNGLKLKAEIYSESIDVLQKLKEKGYIIATLTDLPNAMPDEIFKRDILQLLPCFDYYVSSSVAGYRKPNCRGLEMIAKRYGVPIEELVFIGDEEKDRKTATNANCKFIQIDRTKSKTGCIGILYELLDLL